MFAVRQGKPLARNLRRALLEKQLAQAAVEISRLISTGDKYATPRGRWSVKGSTIRLKDGSTDGLDKFNDLPDMDEKEDTELPSGWRADVVRNLRHCRCCGGCGVKAPPSCRAH